MSATLNTPVLFLIFNRPETTERVFQEIRNARPARLYVAADGPREQVPGESARVQAARAVLGKVDWPCEVQTLFRDRNLGCKAAVSSGITWFFDREPEGIILEDDCLPSKSFFGYCRELLARYRNETRVMMIGGTNYVADAVHLPASYCFSRYFSIWGWASWRRVWKQYDIEMKDWPRRKKEQELRRFYEQGFMRRHMAQLFDLAYEGRVDTWDAQFAYSCLFHGGLSAVPGVNLISNIGAIGTHTAANVKNVFLPTAEMDAATLVHPGEISPDRRHDTVFFERLFRKSAYETARDIARKVRDAFIHRDDATRR